ncbi:YheC/YheD family protein [Alicyclobacillus fastidiosus]|uniref:YheC/YheD family protein n=1 Tax=Alicyclobacillus fastidiosus TaxID=392011 RepID=A0ABV5AGV4_9BACL|nr:YheC/YheD family protein [Alicyclobacillus fastidiosus]WEH07852.1 YheC/YheD family protein [Alicyclobacillus fastidiosus]
MRMSVEIAPNLRGNQIQVSGFGGQTLPNKLLFGGRMTTVKCTRRTSQAKTSAVYVSTALASALFGVQQGFKLHVQSRGGVWKLGPVVGLYVDRVDTTDRQFGEQTRMFEELSTYGQALGAFIAVQTPGDVGAKSAQVYNGAAKKWMVVNSLTPDLVLRRTGTFHKSRAQLARRELQQLMVRGRLHTLPQQCSNKWMLYQVLRSTSELRGHLPTSTLCTNGTQLFQEVMARSDVYVKPPGGSQGVSVYHMKRKGAAIQVSFERRVVPRRTERYTKVFEPRTNVETLLIRTPQECAAFWKRTRLARAVVQDTIELPKSDGKPYDFRWLVQSSDQPTVVARVARVGQSGAVTTNIHTGGAAHAAEDLVQKVVGKDGAKDKIAKMDELASAVVKTLATRYGPFAELGVDLALTPDGRIFIFEVNPTPGRRMLRMLSPDTRRLSLESLLEYAIRATGFGG